MEGDRLARGARSATFAVAPKLKFDEGQMRDDLKTMDSIEFIAKYMITHREYDLLIGHDPDGEEVNTFVVEMKQRADATKREMALDKAKEDSLARECDFLEPFVPIGLTGRVIVNRDRPAKPQSTLALPRSMRKDKELLPTTGHILVAVVFNNEASDIGFQFVGRRVMFSPMSGTAICFSGYPTWIQLDLAEILAFVNKEDIQLVEETLEPMV